MAKEIEPIQQLEARRDSLYKGIGRIRDVYLSDPIRIGQVEVGSSFSITLEVGRTKSAARIAIVGLNNKLEQVDSELRVNDEARGYLNRVRGMGQGLTEMRELVAEGNLPEDILKKHQQEFEELQKLPETNPSLQRAIERIRQEEESRGKANIVVLQDGKVKLPNGSVIEGKKAEFLNILKDTSENNQKSSDQVSNELYPEEDDKIAKRRTYSVIYATEEILSESGVELVTFTPSLGERAIRKKSTYYLRNSVQQDSNHEQIKAEDLTGHEFRLEDVQVVGGEEGKILRKLSPFDSHHIVSRQELMQKLSTEDASIDAQAFDQHLREVSKILDWKRYRLCELPNPRNPDNKDENGYYVETVPRQHVNITLLGDTVRYGDRQNQPKQIKLSEEQYGMLWKLSGGKPKLDKDLADTVSDVFTVASSLNRNLADLTGKEDIVTPLGGRDFGYWHKIKDARIVRRFGYWPIQPTRQGALKLIFQDNVATTKEEIIRTLGPTRGVKRASRLLLEHQATMALRNAIRGLKNRNLQNIATEDEAALYKEMQDYITEHNLTDERDLTRYIAENKLGISRTAFPSTTEEPDSIRDIDVDEVEREILSPSIEAPEFGSLSKADVALIGERLQFNRDRFEPILQQQGIRLIEEDIAFELIGLTEDQEIGVQKQYASGDISVEEFDQLMSSYRARAFEKAKEMLKDPNFGENVDRIGKQNPYVWSLLVNLYEIDEAIKKRAGREEDITLIAQDPEVLKTLLENPENEGSAIEDDLEAAIVDGPTIVFEALVPVEGIKPVEPKPSALERRDPEIRATVNRYLDEILAIPELNGPVSSSMVTRSFPRIKAIIIDQCVKEGWVKGIPSQSNRRVSDHVRFGPNGIATLRYLYENGDRLNARLKKRVQEIAQEEFDKRKDQ